jgi:hypothetical protein
MLAPFATSNGYAACVATSDTLVRARFVGCEDAKFHLEASGANEIYERSLQEIFARTEPRFHEGVRERLGIEPDATSILPADFEARVAVVTVDWRVSIAPGARILQNRLCSWRNRRHFTRPCGIGGTDLLGPARRL